MVPKQKLRVTTVVYWVLLLYIIAAFAWWAFSLLQQNREIHTLLKKNLPTASTDYAIKTKAIEEAEKRGIYKYVGEGSAFLLLICVGAVFIYRSVRQQFRLQQQQQNFVMAVTHELKTPIAVARLNLQTLQKHQLEEEKKKKLLQATLQETLRLDTLINNILIASQLEDHAYHITKEELDFSELVKDAVKAFEVRYPERLLQALIQDDVTINGDATLLKLLLSNLLENANKYSPKDKRVDLHLAQNDNAVFLEVVDEGTGIPDEEKKAVFKKFYRIGNEQTRKTQGTGLGLYICQKIAEDHGGEITVKDNLPTGSKFIVQFYG
ncbi:sensor histidine kinase [Flavisolibacter ginsenosidimutans]|uniref:histidine kinase n=1 Tax=Flavisolibacter ginsenosidimutans TaxID=661481 RepID=A0A5B8UMY4_9BACT|nr:ATP-binding protein [Flavisolibacter ginsenosidimutans]QEC57440.1 GHKL domain-containing protein [Flavisolibacter ginsenosidimutans]